ncbi:hypothetical protein SFB10_2344 [Serratia liquefaciens]|nr:hypothetical protein SFB10_2344 [Serratia liquefaciens]
MIKNIENFDTFITEQKACLDGTMTYGYRDQIHWR